MNKILKDCDAIALDTGQIYRYVAFKIYEKIKDEIDIDKIIKNDSFEVEKTTQLIYHLTKYYTQQLLLLSFIFISFLSILSRIYSIPLPVLNCKLNPRLYLTPKQFIICSPTHFSEPPLVPEHIFLK